MKLLLTSAGLRNKSIANALLELTGKDFEKSNLAYIPTAMNVESDDKGWFIDSLTNCQKLKFASIDIVDISAMPQKIWEPRLNQADILMFGGGNTFHLMYWINKSGLKEILPEMLKEKVYIGISAGSIVTSESLVLSDSENLYDEEEANEEKISKGLGFIDFHIKPHLNLSHSSKLTSEDIKELAKDIKSSIYALDNESAIKIIDREISVVSEGKWEKFD